MQQSLNKEMSAAAAVFLSFILVIASAEMLNVAKNSWETKRLLAAETATITEFAGSPAQNQLSVLLTDGYLSK